MFDIGVLGDLALGAAALAGLRGLRKDVKVGFENTAQALELHSEAIENHETRLGDLEVIEIIAGEPTLVGFQLGKAMNRKK